MKQTTDTQVEYDEPIQYSIEKPQISTQCFEKERILGNNPLRGGKFLILHINVQIQDDSK
jgi:hypothetical protein